MTDSAALREHLVAQRIAGDVATSREDNLRKYAMFADRAPGAMFGLEPTGRWDFADILDLMARRVGVSPDPDYRRGPDRIDAALTIAGLDRMAERLAAAAATPGARVIVATGHPSGLAARAPRGGRCPAQPRRPDPDPGPRLELPGRDGHRLVAPGDPLRRRRGDGQQPWRAQPHPLTAADAGDAAVVGRGRRAAPDLVVGDHGWVGAAGQAGVTAVGFADSNDPGLFVGEEEGTVAVAVPLDDNVAPHLYAPVTTYLLSAAGLSSGR